MRFEGNVARDGRFWLAEIPMLEAATQGRTRAEALEMIGDSLETMVPTLDRLDAVLKPASPDGDFAIRESTR